MCFVVFCGVVRVFCGYFAVFCECLKKKKSVLRCFADVLQYVLDVFCDFYL